MEAAVDIFYARVLADPRISHFFRFTSMATQTSRQRAFLAYAFGAPLSYTGKDLRTAHAHLVDQGLNDAHFSVVLEHLAATLKELGVSDDLIAEAASIANGTRHDVLGRLPS